VKTATGPLTTHLAAQVTCLATLWRVTRVDGNVFGFTNHDRDLVYDGTTFEAATGYKRTALTHRSDMSVSEMEAQGLLDEVRDILDANLLNSDNITDVDLRNGKFNGAVFEVFLVNWADLTQGAVKLLKGNLGRVSLRDGIYTTEFRGLLHRYQKTIVEQSSPSCRADLFDARCGLDPDSFEEQNRVASATDRREFVYSGLVAASGATFAAITNPGAETGDTTGWEQADDTDAALSALTIMGAVTPRTGTYLFGSTSSVDSGGLQQVVSATPGAITESDIDEGRQSVGFYAYHLADQSDRQTQFRIECLDYLSNVITSSDSDPVDTPTGGWAQVGHAVPMPIGTRSVRVAMIGLRTPASGALDVGFDDVIAVIGDLGDTDLTETGDYYDGGHLEWLSGGNQGLSMEVKTVDVGTNTIELFLPMPFTIEASHRFAIWPGCQKRLIDDCKTKFSNVVNFRGEPYLPGQDHLFKFPDAQ
jgi:uncharacterized phage protein (TIGR02218 family)